MNTHMNSLLVALFGALPAIPVDDMTMEVGQKFSHNGSGSSDMTNCTRGHKKHKRKLQRDARRRNRR